MEKSSCSLSTGKPSEVARLLQLVPAKHMQLGTLDAAFNTREIPEVPCLALIQKGKLEESHHFPLESDRFGLELTSCTALPAICARKMRNF